MSRQQLPPQIRKLVVTEQATGKKVTRYEVRVDASTRDVLVENDDGTVSVRRSRVQTKRRYASEKAARTALEELIRLETLSAKLLRREQGRPELSAEALMDLEVREDEAQS